MSYVKKFLLGEKVVPINKTRTKKQIDPFKLGTFGIEIEFKILDSEEEVEEYKSKEILKHFYEMYPDNISEDLQNEYDHWLFAKNLFPKYETVEEWEKANPDKEITTREYADILDWETHKQYYYRKFVQYLLGTNKWEQYLKGKDALDFFNEDRLFAMSEPKDNLETVLQEYGETVGGYDYTTWTIEEDAPGDLEVISRILDNSDMGMLKKVLEGFKSSLKHFLHPGTSAHVHVGVGEDFSSFDGLVVIDSIDEDMAFGEEPERHKTYTKSKKILNENILQSIRKDIGGNGGQLEEAQLKSIMQDISDESSYYGVSMSYLQTRGGKPTIEFRYLSSTILDNIPRFLEWIRYYNVLVYRVAKSRKTATLETTSGDILKIKKTSKDGIYDVKITPLKQ